MALYRLAKTDSFKPPVDGDLRVSGADALGGLVVLLGGGAVAAVGATALLRRLWQENNVQKEQTFS